MPRGIRESFKAIGVCFVCFLVFFSLSTAKVMAAANSQVHYQGKLFDSSGSPVTNNTYSIQFKLYNVSSGGTALWSETQSITTSGGLFTALLGSVTSFPSDFDWNQSLYLGITVGSDSEMTPRHTVGAVPAAHTITGKLGVAQGGTGTTTQHASGSVLFAGANGVYSANANQLFINATNGFVGIGTSTPIASLHVNGAEIAGGVFTGATPGIARISGSGAYNSDDIIALDFGLTGVGGGAGSNPLARIAAEIEGGGSLLHFGTSNSYVSGITNTAMTINGIGNVGIGTTSPTAQLHTTGSVRFQTFGAGTLQTDASGNVSVSSDERLKNVEGDFSLGLEALRGINPIRYRWNATSGMEMESIYAGFSAQNVMDHIEDAVGIDQNGYFTLNDRPIIAATVNAIKELDITVESLASTSATVMNEDGSKTFLGRFFDRLTMWLGDVTNGIGDLFAKSFRAQDTICVGSTCVSEEELAELLLNSGVRDSSGSNTTNSSTQVATSTESVADSSTATTTEQLVDNTSATTTAQTSESSDGTTTTEPPITQDETTVLTQEETVATESTGSNSDSTVQETSTPTEGAVSEDSTTQP